MLTPHLGPRCLGRVVPGWVPGLSVHRRARTHARPLGVVAADPFGPLLLPPDTDAAPSSQPDLFGEFLNSAAPATQPTPFPSTHSAPPPACSTNFLRLGEGGHGFRGQEAGLGVSVCGWLQREEAPEEPLEEPDTGLRTALRVSTC